MERKGENRMAKLKARARWLTGIVTLLAALAAPQSAFAVDPVVAAAGDIACDPADPSFNAGAGTATACRQLATSDVLVNGGFDAVIALGDNQYNAGTLANYRASYDPSWGRVKVITRPAIGNHEGTLPTEGRGYCSYFGAAAHCSPAGNQSNAAFYSWNVGTWHVVVLNSNCAAAGGCDVGSPQYSWLSRDLAASTAACTLAYWHHPRWSSGHDGSNAFMQPIWQLLYSQGVDVVLSGHSHDYERFAPMDGNGLLNTSDGMRQFVVGTGGNSFTALGGVPEANSEVRQGDTYGILKLTLHPTSYDFAFIPEAGRFFTDTGSGSCSVPDTTAPSVPTGLTARPNGATQVDLSWTASTDNKGVGGYDIRRRVAGGTFATIGTSTTTRYSDTTAQPSRRYDYQVRARDTSGNVSAYSTIASATTPATGAPVPPPSATPPADPPIVADSAAPVASAVAGTIASGPSAAAAPLAPARLDLLGRVLVARNGRVRPAVQCAGAPGTTCSAKLVLRAGTRVLATATVRVPAGQRVRASLKLRRDARALLRRRVKLAVTLRVGGAAAQRFTLRRSTPS